MENNGKEYEIIIEDDWVRVIVKNDILVSADFLIQVLKELYSMEAYQSDKVAALWDFRGCMSDINYDSMIKIKKYIDDNYDPNWSHSITAFVVDHDLLYGLSRMYENISDDLPTTLRIFKEIDEAQDWLKEEINKKKRKHSKT